MSSPSTTPVWIALGRLTFGATGDLYSIVSSIGYSQWVESQLAMRGDDPATAAELANVRLTISYPADFSYPAVNEVRPLWALQQSLSDCFAIRNAVAQQTLGFGELFFLLTQIRVATMIRQVSSQAQIFEKMAAFWHNHFSIQADQSSDTLAGWPSYDRDVIRANALGNFRVMVEAVTKSTAMLDYLDNNDSRAAQPNENYARELMELHTLGAGNYFDHQYPTWDAVPKVNGVAVGFIDQDVFDAAKALSGWVYGNNQRPTTTRRLFPDGAFVYEPVYHSTAPARVLGVDLSSLTAPMAAGQRVLDLVSYHPNTAKFVVGKIVKWFMGANPPQAVIDRAVDTWMASQTAPDQIARVVRTIAYSPEFFATANSYYRTPYEQMIAFARATGGTIRATTVAPNIALNTGYKFFNWPTPDGLPADTTYWQSSNTLQAMTNVLFSAYEGASYLTGNLLAQCQPLVSNPDALITFWSYKMLGGPLPADKHAALVADAAGTRGITPVVNARGNLEVPLRRLVALIANTPEFTYN